MEPRDEAAEAGAGATTVKYFLATDSEAIRQAAVYL
jgi:hypothetical protein